MANKLKNMLLKSVDLVRRGANPDADIKLYKSFDGEPGAAIMKSAEEVEDMIFKSEDAFDAYTDILKQSFSSIVNDESLQAGEVRDMLTKSLCEFTDTVRENIVNQFTFAKSIEEEREVNEMANVLFDSIDKSLLSAEEQSQLDTLLAKACKVKKEDDPMEEEKKKLLEGEGKEEEGMEKSMHPEVAKALARMENLAKSMEMKELEELAKKYEPLGEKSEDLAKKFYEMKQTGAYDEYISVLDKSLDVMHKSGLFGEIGKSAYQSAPTYGGFAKSDAETKIEAIAGEIMKSAPGMDYVQAVAKAWEDHPELAVEYEESRR